MKNSNVLVEKPALVHSRTEYVEAKITQTADPLVIEQE